MTPNLDVHLTHEEFASLAECAKGPMKKIIPEAHKVKLKELGFIAEKLGGLGVTDAGQMRLARGK